MRRRVTQVINEIDEAIQCEKTQSLELWLRNLELFKGELKSLQHEIEEYLDDESIDTESKRFMEYHKAKEHNRRTEQMYRVLSRTGKRRLEAKFR